MRLSIVIPCLNEAPCIPRFRSELYPALDSLGIDYEVVIVDDGSRDGTSAALDELARERPLRRVTHKQNQGLGAALRSGFSAADGEWIVALDADLTFSPSEISKLLEMQRKTSADLVAGSPYLETRGLDGVPWTRRLPSLALNAFYRGLFSHAFTAYTPMFRLYRRSSLTQLNIRSEGFEISAELAARFIQRKWKVAEVPVKLTTRREGVSKLNRWRELKRHFVLIARLLARPN